VWRRPDPKKDFVLSVAFAIQRGCSSTLLRAASRRRSRQAAAVRDPEAHSNYYYTGRLQNEYCEYAASAVYIIHVFYMNDVSDR
jgi:hypothetical protein